MARCRLPPDPFPLTSAGMADFAALAAALDRTEKELKEEAAGSLARSGEKLTELLERLKALRVRHAAASLSERATIAAEHDALLVTARHRLWELTVQREALGLRRHDGLAAAYPLPEPLGRLPPVPGA